MIKTKHYIPILKWKRAEQGALSELAMKNKKHITPLIQFVMPKPKQAKKGESEKTEDEKYDEVLSLFKEKIPFITTEILDCWGKDSIFIDFSLIYTTDLKIKSCEKIATEGKKLGLKIIPVINLSDDESLIKVACDSTAKIKSGLCLRLVCSDFVDINTLQVRINKLLKANSLLEDGVDILVDIKEIKNGDGKFDEYINLSQKLPSLKKWRSFIFASGAFPQYLTECKIDELNLIPRQDWKQWRDILGSKKLQRLPSFADYTIQYPIYNEATQFFHPTTSIKYALENEWNIMKGKKQKFELYLAHANVLYGDKDYFFGEDFSFGDKFIADKGRHYEKYIKNPVIKGTGNTEQWIKASINHHLECTANQIANLF